MSEYRWITVKAAAVLAKVSPRFIYANVRRGALRSVRVGAGRSVRTTEQWVSDWLIAGATGGPGQESENVNGPRQSG